MRRRHGGRNGVIATEVPHRRYRGGNGVIAEATASSRRRRRHRGGDGVIAALQHRHPGEGRDPF
jgi:hypothetical protein